METNSQTVQQKPKTSREELLSLTALGVCVFMLIIKSTLAAWMAPHFPALAISSFFCIVFTAGAAGAVVLAHIARKEGHTGDALIRLVISIGFALIAIGQFTQ